MSYGFSQRLVGNDHFTSNPSSSQNSFQPPVSYRRASSFQDNYQPPAKRRRFSQGVRYVPPLLSQAESQQLVHHYTHYTHLPDERGTGSLRSLHTIPKSSPVGRLLSDAKNRVRLGLINLPLKIERSLEENLELQAEENTAEELKQLQEMMDNVISSKDEQIRSFKELSESLMMKNKSLLTNLTNITREHNKTAGSLRLLEDLVRKQTEAIIDLVAQLPSIREKSQFSGDRQLVSGTGPDILSSLGETEDEDDEDGMLWNSVKTDESDNSDEDGELDSSSSLLFLEE